MTNLIKRYYIVMLVAIGTFSSSYSQQLSFYNTNIINPFTINPSQAGISNNQLYFHHRNELLGIEGAPQFSMLTAEFRLKESKSAIGFQFSHDKANIIRNNTGFMTYAHHFKLNEKSSLSFGLSLGLIHNSIDFDRVNAEDQGDKILFDYNQSKAKFDGNFGVTYRFKELEIQASSLQLFGNKTNYTNSFEDREFQFQYVRHFVASIGYQFRSKKQFKITPMIQARGVQGQPFMPEAIVRLDYNDFFWSSLHYRNQAAFAATLGLRISNRYTIGYSAEFSYNKIAGYSGGTHEIVFGIKLNAPKSSGVKGSKIKEIEKRNRSYEERLEYLNQENKKLEEELNKQREKIDKLNESSEKLDYEKLKELLLKDGLGKPKEKEEIKKIELKSKRIEFESGNDKLKTISYSALDDLVLFLKENPNKKLEISGYTDSDGNEKSNKKLSQKRADTVKKYLLSKGIDSSKVIAIGYGEENPISTNKTEEGRAKNRRVELKIK